MSSFRRLGESSLVASGFLIKGYPAELAGDARISSWLRRSRAFAHSRDAIPRRRSSKIHYLICQGPQELYLSIAKRREIGRRKSLRVFYPFSFFLKTRDRDQRDKLILSTDLQNEPPSANWLSVLERCSAEYGLSSSIFFLILTFILYSYGCTMSSFGTRHGVMRRGRPRQLDLT